MIPALYGLEGDELEAFNDYRELVGMQMAWKAAGKTVHDLDSTNIALLEIYANESEGDARAIARNILTHGYEHSYCECLHSDDSTLLKNVRGSITKPLAEVVGLKIIARPNPAGSWVAFDFEMKDDHSEGLIRVTENTGKVIQQTKVSGSIGQFVWDTRFVAKGTYIYTLVSNGFSKSGKLIIQ